MVFSPVWQSEIKGHINIIWLELVNEEITPEADVAAYSCQVVICLLHALLSISRELSSNIIIIMVRCHTKLHVV